MIKYNEGTWGILFAFQLRGSLFQKALAVAIPAAIVTALIHQQLHGDSTEDAAISLQADVKSNLHQGFTFVLGFLIVFRTQKAYSRWEEGGSLLQQLRGDWFNAFSNLMAFLNKNDKDAEENVEIFKHTMVRLFSLLYGHGLQQVMEVKGHTLEFFDLSGFDQKSIALLENTHDSCEIILQWIQRAIVEANQNNLIKIAPPILGRVYNQLGLGIVKLNNARKIRQFPVPFPLAQLIAILLILHWVSTVLLCALMISNILLATFTCFIVVFSYWGVNYIAVELENPYGEDPNDLPIRWMQEDLNKSLVALLHQRALKPPKFTFNPDPEQGTGEASIAKEMRKVVQSRDTGDMEDMDDAGPHVDNCMQGSPFAGSALFGDATDSSYRDSALAGVAGVVQSRALGAVRAVEKNLPSPSVGGEFNLLPVPAPAPDKKKNRKKPRGGARRSSRGSANNDSSDEGSSNGGGGGGAPLLCGGCCAESEEEEEEESEDHQEGWDAGPSEQPGIASHPAAATVAARKGPFGGSGGGSARHMVVVGSHVVADPARGP